MMKKKTLNIFYKPLQNNRGSLLIIAFFTVLVLTGLGASFVILSTNEALVAERHLLSTKAFHIAEAGAERAFYDLNADLQSVSPSWTDGDINGMTIGPDTNNYYTVPYTNTSFDGGSYTVELKNVSGSSDNMWVRSTSTISGITEMVTAMVRIVDGSPWNYAIFAGAGASGTMVNGNVDIRGSVLILGDGLSPGDMAIDIGGTAEIVGNNYFGMDSSLEAKVPALDTVVVGGETVETLGAVLRVKKGVVGISGSSSVGQPNQTGNGDKELVDGVYVTEGFGGNKGASGVYSDNGTSNAYDLGDNVAFPSLSDPYPGYASYQDYLKSNALVLTSELSNIKPDSNFSYTNANGSITMDGNGNMTIDGIVYVDGSNNIAMTKQGSDTTITYTGKGSLLSTGDVSIGVNLVTSGNNSFPTNIMGIMTPNNINFNDSQVDIMGLFYAETQINSSKQTDVVGSFVANYFNMGTNVPAIYQVPEAAENLPPGMIGGNLKSLALVGWLQG